MRLFINILMGCVVFFAAYIIIGTIARSCSVSSNYVKPIENEFNETGTSICEYVTDDGDFDCYGVFDKIVLKRDNVVEENECIFLGKWLVYASGNDRLVKHTSSWTICSPFWFL